MSTGLYPDFFGVERFSASPATGNVTQRFIAPFDLDVFGLLLYVTTAPGAGDTLTVNVSNLPTSQQCGTNASVAAYNLWTAANVPSIVTTATTNVVTTNSTTLVENIPYALNYPLPGQSPVTGYETAQSTAQATYTAVTAPPNVFKYQMNALTTPDNTYTDYNGITLTPAGVVHAGDVLTFVIGGVVGAAANLEMLLYCYKR